MISVFGRAFAALSIGLAAVALPVAASATVLTFTNTTDGGTTAGPGGSYNLKAGGTGYSILRFVNNEAITFGALTDLNFDFVSTFGGFGAGGPRVAVVLDTDNDHIGDSQMLFHVGGDLVRKYGAKR